MPRCFLAAKLKYPYIKWKEGQEEGETGGNRTGDLDTVAGWRLGGGGPMVVRMEEKEEEKEEVWWRGGGVRAQGSSYQSTACYS